MPLTFTGRKAVKVWNGSSWVGSNDFGRIKMWNGSSWVGVGIQPYEDVVVTFSPAGGTSAGAPTYLSDYNIYPGTASVTVSCSISATWTYSYSGDAPIASVGSGGSATSISFTLISDFYSFYNTVINLTGTAGGTTRYWQIQLNTDGNV